ncbi:hypothetical protein E3P81_03395 [Wallemia ichthyophaga]|uniref:peptidyl-tRNA hydrolase n=1 Tax=Wallemia ichthyophaga (strain EXF-994 / CBS 113033) TaxID=1299270 RepID=R9AE38_WALI9|nr:putative peptidyl-tRNA hydrolase 2 [Wallemia ichthyophaga EXF-994]TIA71909.1 hypothetical protein E3P91_02275 [Wallemia ichthyophaga]EOR00395.1 putative peptidyl-tRNA hydrolase 2 [Wallemia ichthyophaga EXF-994]TIA88620.1 hypothetical protein E3P97_03432 [Wallemia ichthyophaga]TIB04380.1 hypothetical protein E3P95_00181 [Wallemia ichthyophaga]TIB05358.1 hypothetical protein E3P94_00181 [Wallemia ichthyophaga]
MSSLSSAPPKLLALYITVPILAFGMGYLLGRPSGSQLRTTTDSEEEDSDDEPQEGLGSVKPSILEPCKMVLVVRTDLGMTKGKIAAQCSHATLACYKALQQSNPALLRHWERTGQAKITVQAKSEEELMILQAQAQSVNVCAKTIQDAGRTQIEAGSTTVLGVGPAPVDLVNVVTSEQKLL